MPLSWRILMICVRVRKLPGHTHTAENNIDHYTMAMQFHPYAKLQGGPFKMIHQTNLQVFAYDYIDAPYFSPAIISISVC